MTYYPDGISTVYDVVPQWFVVGLAVIGSQLLASWQLAALGLGPSALPSVIYSNYNFKSLVFSANSAGV